MGRASRRKNTKRVGNGSSEVSLRGLVALSAITDLEATGLAEQPTEFGHRLLALLRLNDAPQVLAAAMDEQDLRLFHDIPNDVGYLARLVLLLRTMGLVERDAPGMDVLSGERLDELARMYRPGTTPRVYGDGTPLDLSGHTPERIIGTLGERERCLLGGLAPAALSYLLPLWAHMAERAPWLRRAGVRLPQHVPLEPVPEPPDPRECGPGALLVHAEEFEGRDMEHEAQARMSDLARAIDAANLALAAYFLPADDGRTGRVVVLGFPSPDGALPALVQAMRRVIGLPTGRVIRPSQEFIQRLLELRLRPGADQPQACHGTVAIGGEVIRDAETWREWVEKLGQD